MVAGVVVIVEVDQLDGSSLTFLAVVLKNILYQALREGCIFLLSLNFRQAVKNVG